MSKGGTTSGSTEIPAWLENAAIENINKARDVSQIGYVPYYGPDVAAFSPMQQQSMQSTGNAASAFGLAPQGFDAMAGMPQAQTFAGGIQGYSSAPLYEQSLDNLFANAPAQYRALNQQFIDPFTGARPRSAYGATPMQTSQMVSGGGDGNGQADFVDQVHKDRMGQMSSTGRYYGVNSQYNPYAGTMMTDSSGEWLDNNGDGVADYRDMSFGEDGRREIGNIEKIGNFINPFKFVDGIQGSLFDFMGKGKVSEDPAYLAQQQELINTGAERYSARMEEDRLQSAAKIQAAMQAEADYNQQMQREATLLENLRLSAVTTPVAPAVITRGGGNDGPKGNNNPYSGYSKPNPNEGGRPTQSSSPF